MKKVVKKKKEKSCRNCNFLIKKSRILLFGMHIKHVDIREVDIKLKAIRKM